MQVFCVPPRPRASIDVFKAFYRNVMQMSRLCTPMPVCCVDDEIFMDALESIAFKFGSAPDFYPIEIDPVPDDVITFTC